MPYDDGVSTSRPSLALLRSLSDETVLRALMSGAPLTRAQIATATGLSKPTAAEAMRRLEGAGLVRDTGQRTTGRGGVGTYYALTAEAGVALALSIAPDGIVVEVVDPAGSVEHRTTETVGRPATPRSVTRLLRRAVRRALGGREPGAIRAVVVSAADPVDRTTGALVHLPDAPFLIGALSPVEVLQPLVQGPIVVDNDVNWAARAERDARRADGRALEDFAYVYLGEGLGCAIVSDGDVRRGSRGIAGEIAYVPVPGPSGESMPFIEVFARLDLRRPDSTAIDVERLLAVFHESAGGSTTTALIRAVCAVLLATTVFADPECIVVGGPWGADDAVLGSLQDAFGARPRAVSLTPPQATREPSLTGARTAAIDLLRNDIVARAAD